MLPHAASQQPAQIRGRVHRLKNWQIGRFGWKAQVATLEDFVLTACANELGLEAPGHGQAVSPLAPDARAKAPDLTLEECDALAAYVQALPAPIQLQEGEPRAIEAGRASFEEVGCADCHRPRLGNIEGIYSDLLLHRMDPGMAGSGGYNDRREPVPTADPNGSPDPSEWRTPQLWGVADSAPYMHDGRADTLEEAIALHGGQGQRSALHFNQKLNRGEQLQLIAFLKTLRAP